ncbi:hypothetical protein ACCS86_37400, partial [Rhizobium ruizarguesonis]
KDDLPKAKTLFSRTEDGSLFAQTAVSGLPRKERVATLCATELQGQLVHGSPRYLPSALPSFVLASTETSVGGPFRSGETSVVATSGSFT